MKRTLDVCLGRAGVRIGVLRYEQDGAREHASFAYDDAWRTTTDAFPLDPTLPLVAGPQFHRQERGGSLFHLAIADTEPDGWGRTVIRRDAAKRRAAARSEGQVVPAIEGELDYLLGVDDFCRVGALRFRDEHGTFWRPSADGHRTTPPLIELADLYAASRAVEQETETAADLAYLLGRGTSLGGLRPKCADFAQVVRRFRAKVVSGFAPRRSVISGHAVHRGQRGCTEAVERHRIGDGHAIRGMTTGWWG